MIYRAPKEPNKEQYYTPTLNAPANNKELSFAARGMLWYLLTQADSWRGTTGDLIKQSPAGEHAIRSALRELVKHGYLVQRVERTADGTRNKRFYYDVYEEPQLGEHLDCDSHQVENLRVENHQLIINKSQQEIKEREIFEYPEDLIGLQFYETQVGESIEPFADQLRDEIKRLGEARVIGKAKTCTNGESWQYLLKSLAKLDEKAPEIAKQKQKVAQGDQWQSSGYAVSGDETPLHKLLDGLFFPNETEQVTSSLSPESQKLFDMAYEQLERQFDKSTFYTWMNGMKPVDYCTESNVMKIEVKNQYAVDMLQNRYYRNIRRVVSDAFNKQIELVFTLASQHHVLPGLKTGHVSACPA